MQSDTFPERNTISERSCLRNVDNEDSENIKDTHIRGYTSDGKLTGPLQINFPNRPTIYFTGQDAEDIANFCEQYSPDIFSLSSIKDDYQR